MNSDTIKGRLKQAHGLARETWGRLTNDELVRIRGSALYWSGFAQERYGVARAEAARQVNLFLTTSATRSSRY